MSVFTDLQGAIFTKLTTAGLSCYDDVPQDEKAFPYVTIGDDDYTSDDTDGYERLICNINIYSWSRYRGSKEVKDTMGTVYSTLHRQDVTVLGYNVLGIDHVSTSSAVESDGITRRGIQTFKIILTKG